jgi:hypothetical protein
LNFEIKVLFVAKEGFMLRNRYGKGGAVLQDGSSVFTDR